MKRTEGSRDWRNLAGFAMAGLAILGLMLAAWPLAGSAQEQENRMSQDDGAVAAQPALSPGEAEARLKALLAQPKPAAPEISITANLIVTNTNDDGSGSLREAINVANALVGPDVIGFNIPGDPPHVITLSSAGLSPITEELTILGLAEPDQLVIDGGGLFRPFQNDAGSTLTLQVLTIRNGSADATGGGGVLNSGILTVNNCTITGNTSIGRGGGIYNIAAGTANIFNSLISSNTVTGPGEDGGGVSHAGSGTVRIVDTRLTRNKVLGGPTSNGGGIYGVSGSGPIEVWDCLIDSNSVDQGGGGLYPSSTSVFISGTSVIGNVSLTNSGGGGGMASEGGPVVVVNSTFSGNNANDSGGGIRNIANLTCINVTIANNTADNDADTIGNGGGLWNTGSASIGNTLIANNTDRGGEFPDISGPITSLGHNLIGNVGDQNFAGNIAGDQYGDPNATTTPSIGAIESATAIDPIVSLMAVDFGGKWPTIALLPGSPAINAGTNSLLVSPPFDGPPFYDQRGPGFDRIVDGTVDIGAFERAGEPDPVYELIVDTSDDVDNGIFVPGDRSLRECIRIANERSGADTITFAIPGAAPHTITLTANLPDNTDELQILGPGAPEDLVIDGDNAFHPFVNISGQSLTLENLTITRGSASTSGGGVLNSGILTVSNCVITANTSVNSGGGIASSGAGAIINITDSTISNNTVTLDTEDGGGLANLNSSTAVVTRCSIIGNAVPAISGSLGGGIINYLGGSNLTVRDSLIADNFGFHGGAIWTSESTTIINSTISGNRAQDNGGGVRVNGGSTLIHNSTITGNVADDDNSGTGNGGGLSTTAQLNISHCLVAENIDRGGENPDISGNITSLSYNLIGNVGATNFASNTTGDQYGDPNNTTTPNAGANESGMAIDPMLSGLAGFGGPTAAHKPAPGSPAINAGDPAFDPNDYMPPLDYDQRGPGFPRVLDGIIDIGAVESDGAPIAYVVDIAEDEDDGNYATGDLSLREAILIANSTPAFDTITFAIPGAGPHTITLTEGPLPDITSSVNIIGPGEPEQIVVDGNNAFRPFLNTGGTTLTLEALTITRGFSGGDGGALQNQGNAIITKTILKSNTASSWGGAINNGNATLVMHDSQVTSNTAGFGGGIYVGFGSNVIITSSLFGHNIANSTGGGIRIANDATATIRNSTFADNEAGSNGGGAALGIGSAQIVNSTFSGNKSNGSGGGLVATTSGILTALHCTITNNTCDDDDNGSGNGGGVGKTGSASPLISHCLIAGNLDKGGEVPDLDADIISNGYNLIGNVGNTDFASNTTGDQYGDPNGTTTPNAGATEFTEAIDPEIGSLQDNGGPTLTHALLVDSLAVDAGDPAFDPNAYMPPLATDQRGAGFPRVQNGRIDIGAVEAARPIAECNDVVTTAGLGCTANVTGEEAGLASFDPDGVIVSYVLDPPGPYPLGDTVVTLIVTDDAGFMDSCSATITVVDLTLPEITCPALPVTPPCDSSDGAIVDLTGLATATDNCTAEGDIVIEYSPASGSLFPPGTTTVIATARDESGNESTCEFDVFLDCPVACPLPEVVTEYDFTSGADGWTSSGSPPLFPLPEFAIETGALRIGPSEFFGFGFLQSPSNAIPAASSTDLLAVVMTASTALPQCDVPTVRVRAVALNLGQSMVLDINSTDDCLFSPDADGETYALFFRPQFEGDGQDYLIAFDWLFFDPGDTGAAGGVLLESAAVLRVPECQLGGQTLVRDFTFDTSEEGWTSSALAAPITDPVFEYTGNGLKMTAPTTVDTYGFWNSNAADVTLKAGVLYKSVATVTLDAGTGGSGGMPVFRLRYFAANGQAATVLNTPILVSGERTYEAYFLPPQTIEGASTQGVVLGFDMLSFDPFSADNPSVELESWQVYETQIPALP